MIQMLNLKEKSNQGSIEILILEEEDDDNFYSKKIYIYVHFIYTSYIYFICKLKT